MKTLSLAPLLVILTLSSPSFADPDAAIQGDNNSINNACADDAKTAGCAGEVVGKGLLRCIGAYKKANKSFKVSEGCKTAMKQRKSDKASGK